MVIVVFIQLVFEGLMSWHDRIMSTIQDLMKLAHSI